MALDFYFSAKEMISDLLEKAKSLIKIEFGNVLFYSEIYTFFPLTSQSSVCVCIYLYTHTHTHIYIYTL